MFFAKSRWRLLRGSGILSRGLKMETEGEVTGTALSLRSLVQVHLSVKLQAVQEENASPQENRISNARLLSLAWQGAPQVLPRCSPVSTDPLPGALSTLISWTLHAMPAVPYSEVPKGKVAFPEFKVSSRILTGD